MTAAKTCRQLVVLGNLAGLAASHRRGGRAYLPATFSLESFLYQQGKALDEYRDHPITAP